MNDFLIILGYVLFLFTLGVIVGMGAPQILDNPPATPTLATSPIQVLERECDYACVDDWAGTCGLSRTVCNVSMDLWYFVSWLAYVFSSIWYFFIIIGMTSVAYPLLGAILLGYSLVVLYVILKLIRGN